MCVTIRCNRAQLSDARDELLQSSMMSVSQMGLPENQKRRIKSGGIHYTPPLLASFLANRIGERINGARTLRILDPACGDGSLLNAAAEMFTAREPRPNVELIGFDTDPSAVGLAQRRLHKWGRHGNVRVSTADFLAIATPSTHLPFLDDAAADVPEADVVIANPPYVRTQVLGAERSRDLASRFGLSGRVDLYHAFLKAISVSLRPGGVLGLLTSNRFLVTRAGQSMRDALVQDFELCEIWDLGDTKLFEAAVLPAILVARRGQASSKSVEFSRVYEMDSADHSGLTRFADVVEPLQSGFTGQFSVGDIAYDLQRGVLKDSSADAVWTLSSPDTECWLTKVLAHTACELTDVARVRVGIKTTADSVFIRTHWSDLPAAQQPESELLSPLLTHHVAERWKATSVLPSRVLYPYDRTATSRRPICLDRFPRAKAYLEHNRERLQSRQYVIDAGREWFEIWVAQNPSEWGHPKLVWPDISETPKFFIDESGAVVNGDCYWLRLRDTVPRDVLYLIAGVANSTFATTYYDTVFHNKLYSGRRRFITQYVERFPLPDPESAIAREIVDLVKRRVNHPDTTHVDEAIDRLVWNAFGFNQRNSLEEESEA